MTSGTFSPTLGPAIAGRALVGAGDACMFLNVLRVAAHWLPPHRYALATALTGVAGSIGQLMTTAPLSAALGDLGWTPTFAASGLLTVTNGAAGRAALELASRVMSSIQEHAERVQLEAVSSQEKTTR